MLMYWCLPQGSLIVMIIIIIYYYNTLFVKCDTRMHRHTHTHTHMYMMYKCTQYKTVTFTISHKSCLCPEIVSTGPFFHKYLGSTCSTNKGLLSILHIYSRILRILPCLLMPKVLSRATQHLPVLCWLEAPTHSQWLLMINHWLNISSASYHVTWQVVIHLWKMTLLGLLGK